MSATPSETDSKPALGLGGVLGGGFSVVDILEKGVEKTKKKKNQAYAKAVPRDAPENRKGQLI